jgi:hypothetical protein
VLHYSSYPEFPTIVRTDEKNDFPTTIHQTSLPYPAWLLHIDAPRRRNAPSVRAAAATSPAPDAHRGSRGTDPSAVGRTLLLRGAPRLAALAAALPIVLALLEPGSARADFAYQVYQGSFNGCPTSTC